MEDQTMLSLTQQFELKKVKDAASKMSKQQALDLLKDATRILMVKNNVIKYLSK